MPVKARRHTLHVAPSLSGRNPSAALSCRGLCVFSTLQLVASCRTVPWMPPVQPSHASAPRQAGGPRAPREVRGFQTLVFAFPRGVMCVAASRVADICAPKRASALPEELPHDRSAVALRWTFLLCDAWILASVGLGSLRQPIRTFLAYDSTPHFVTAVEAVRLVFIASLVLGIWWHARGRRGVRRLVWAQLPVRLFFAALGEPVYLSFAFLRPLALSSFQGPVSPLMILGALAACDVVRALLSLAIRSRQRLPGSPSTPRAV